MKRESNASEQQGRDQQAAQHERRPKSVPEFCDWYGISRAHLYNLIKRGKGPRLSRLGARVLITAQAQDEFEAASMELAE
jgi:predicted DNA-binding transcriptional regulator AlpA